MMNTIDIALLTLWPPALGLIVQEMALRLFATPMCLPSVYLT